MIQNVTLANMKMRNEKSIGGRGSNNTNFIPKFLEYDKTGCD